jgi:hypothetical protein
VDRPARRGGLSARVTRTVRLRTADYPHRYGEPSGLGCGLSVKANRTSSSKPRITDRPRAACRLSARHPRTVRPAHANRPKPRPTKTQNHHGSKTKASKNMKNTRRTRKSRTVRHRHADCPPLTDRAENCSTPKVNSPNSSPDLQTVEAVETRVWGHDKRQTRMLYPKTLPPNSLKHRKSRIL